MIKKLKKIFLEVISLFPLKVGEFKMYLNYDTLLSKMHKRLRSKKEDDFLLGLLKEGDYAVDVGSNVGYYSLFFSDIAGKNGSVYSFEPEKNNYRKLIKNIKLNKVSNIIPNKLAVLDYYGETDLFISKCSVDHRTYRVFGRKIIERVRCVKLDNFFCDEIAKKIKLIKIDIQGAESQAIEGMKELLKNNNIVLFIEYWKYGLNLNPAKNTLIKTLKTLGYEIIDMDTGEHFQEGKIENSFNAFTDLYCKKKKKRY